MTKQQFKNLYLTHFSALSNFARKLTRDEFDSQDLVQIASMKAYRGLHTFREGSNLKSWIFTILKNAYITSYHKKRKRNLIAAPVEDLQHLAVQNRTVDNSGICNLRLDEINQCIKDLSPKSKTPFILYIKGYPYKEIADLLNIPLGTVKSRINFARKKLKCKLNNDLLAA